MTSLKILNKQYQNASYMGAYYGGAPSESIKLRRNLYDIEKKGKILQNVGTRFLLQKVIIHQKEVAKLICHLICECDQIFLVFK